MNTIDRNLHHKIERLLRIFPVVALVGARQVGKTVSWATSLAKGWASNRGP